ncbi:hypothetical protein HMPREF9103_00396 [Lentilactobacillus parafarraginis F0439]|uniref:Penicillin-binding protein dimerisation domain-containing protein n=1 Tax=Lentilactobacillus parafarraginis F0439 TaxID=797515 RepID=G9ZKZ8_9LACO|nr:hypothetical protein HMPREF9103_00396 [Lentilactobacillus parafarraginis F0439]
MKEPSNRSDNNLKARQNRKLVGISLLLIFFVVFFVLSLRLMVIAVGKNVKHVNLNERAEKLYNQTRTLKAKRGTIYDAHGNPIAEDTSTYSIYAVLDKNQRGLDDKPMYVKDKARTSRS